MQVTNLNALTVAAIFQSLTDERFTMRTPAAMVKAANNPAVTEAEVLGVAAEMGLTFRRRIRDNATLIERPATVSIEKAREIVTQAQALVAEGSAAAPFELAFDMDEQPETGAAAAITRALGGANGLGEDDESIH